MGAENLDISSTLPWMLQGLSFITVPISNLDCNKISFYKKTQILNIESHKIKLLRNKRVSIFIR